MSLMSAVQARVAAARRCGDPSGLLAPEAEADALALLREAAPAPDRPVDTVAVAAACTTFYLRSRAAVGGAGPAAGEEQDAAGMAEFVMAAILGGHVLEREPHLLAPELRARLESGPDPLRAARFAFTVAWVHGSVAMTSDAVIATVPGATATGEIDDEQALAVLDRALAWTDSACSGFAGQADTEAYADALAQRITLRSLRFPLAADLGAVAAAARDGLAIAELVPPRDPAYLPYLAVAAEAVARAAYVLGDPPPAEAERVIAGLPAGTAGDMATTVMLMLRNVHEGPVTWPGQTDARAGMLLAQEASSTGHTGIRAAAIRRLRAALAVTPPGHEASRALALALLAALVESGAGIDEMTEEESWDYLIRVGGVFGLLADRLDGPGFPPEAGLAAKILDLLTGMAKSGGPREALTDEWLAAWVAWAERLPVGHPARELSVEGDRDRAVYAVMRTMPEIRWGDLAAAVREGASRHDEETRRRAGEFSVLLEAVPRTEFLKEFTGLGDIARDMAELEATFDSPGGSRGEQREFRVALLRGIIAKLRTLPMDSTSAVASLEALAAMFEATDGRGDPEAARSAWETLRTLVRLDDPLARSDDEEELAEGFSLMMMQHVMTDPTQLLALATEWDQETSLIAQALMASKRRRPDTVSEAEARAVERADLVAELTTAMMLLARDSDLSQIARLRELGPRLIDFLRRSGDADAERRITAFLDTLTTVMTGHMRVREEIPAGGGAEGQAAVVAELRARLGELPPDHPARSAVRSQLAMSIALQASMLRTDDPARARELAAEAAGLYNTDGVPEPAAAQFRQFFEMMVSPDVDMMSVLKSALTPQRAPAPAPDAGDQERTVPELTGDLAEDQRRIREFTVSILEESEARLGDLLTTLEQGADELVSGIDRGSDARSAEHVIATRQLLMPQQTIAPLLEHLRVSRNVTERTDDDPSVTGPLVDRAAALTERSRGLLLGRQLESRTDLGALRDEHPDLAREFEALTARLSAVPDDSGPPGTAERIRLDKLRASRELDALIERIRERDGFAEFLSPLTPARLRELAAGGPVVSLLYPAGAKATETLRPWAFVVTPAAITAVRIDAEPDEVTDAAARWRAAISAVNARGAARPGPGELRQAAADLTGILSWTWHQVVSPVLEAAGLPRARAEGDDWPRIWWIPDGPFNALPLHAAQCDGREQCDGRDRGPDGCGAALDAVVSSYVPGFRVLDQVRRETGDGGGTGRPLVVSSTEDDLPGTGAAALEALRVLGASTVVIGSAATRDAVLAGLREVTWAHFGCHAVSDPAEPSGGMLRLPGGEQLPVLEICRARPPAARLAFLTACGTARTAERLPNETIHLSSAFLVAGFSEAVGTLWEIDSRDAYEVTAEFYRRVSPGDSPASAALALHHCARRLRRDRPAMPHAWAAYVHAGA